jgi:heme-degrading monooxygenase HmoA
MTSVVSIAFKRSDKVAINSAWSSLRFFNAFIAAPEYAADTPRVSSPYRNKSGCSLKIK